MTETKYWEDIKDNPTRQYGPLSFGSELLDSLLDQLGEKHPVHLNSNFAEETGRRKRIVPGGFIHSITSGWIVRHAAPVAIVGMRSMHWDFVRPLYPDTPFFFSTETSSSEVVSESLGLLNTVRRVFNESGDVYAIGRLSALVKRRSI